jgi:hypothetical protein
VIGSPSLRAASIFAIACCHLRPVLLARGLQVIGLRVHLGFARDPDQLVERFEKAIALAAHVRDVAAAELARGLAQRDQLIGLRVRRGA